MKDKLEQFISGHSNEFDINEPPYSVWQGIDNTLRRRNKQRILQFAAAACIVALVAFGLWYFTMPVKQLKEDIAVVPADMNGAIPEEISKAEVYYTTLKEKQQRQLSYYCAEYQDVCHDFRSEIDTLDVLYRELKAEYVNSDNNEAVLRAMIENLQEQVKLLSLQLKIIEETRQKHKEVKHII